MGPISRRRALQASAVSLVGVAGCNGRLTGHPRPAERQISVTQPAAGTWPMAGYDPQNAGHNPHATPPRHPPSADWRLQTAEAVSSVIVGPDAVYASTENEVVAVSRDGVERWHTPPGGGLYYVDGRVYVSADETLVALDADSGDDVVVTGAADPGSPSVCVATNDSQERSCTGGEPPAASGVLHGFDADSGERLWTVTPGHSFGGYPIALADDRVYYGDASGLHALS